MARPVSRLELDATQRRELQRIVSASTSTVREVRRARIILLRAEGKAQAEVAQAVQVNRPVVAVWERRFRQQGLAGLQDAKGRGRKSTLQPAQVACVLEEAVRAPAGRQRWSVRTMARHAKVSAATVQRLWSANDIKPHLTRTFKLSKDGQFEAKFWDVIGLYLSPPDKALVLCCDEKSQCQALERTYRRACLGRNASSPDSRTPLPLEAGVAWVRGTLSSSHET